LEKLGHLHEGLNGPKSRLVLLLPLIEQLFNVLVLISFLDDVDKVLAVAIKLSGGHCHFQYKNNQLL